MRTPEQIRARIRTRWDRSWTQWLGGEGKWLQSFSLDPPNEAVARADWPGFCNWLAQWPHVQSEGRLERVIKRWPSAGVQDLPWRLHFDSPASLANVLGEHVAQRYARAEQRWRDRVAAWPDLALPLRAIAAWMADLAPPDYERFVTAVDWLSANPRSDLYLRQLPIPGLHSKWVESNIAPLAALLAARRGADRSQPFLQLAGLKAPSALRRIRLVDPAMRARLGGLSDLTIPLDELARLDLGARVVIVIENLQTALACTDLAGAVVIVGGGFAVTELASVPWLHQIPVLYWGDLDSAGFAILHAFRAHVRQVQSVLMDEESLAEAGPNLWTDDFNPATKALPLLSPTEASLYRRLTSGELGLAVRLEQERLPWPWAWRRLRDAATAALGGTSSEDPVQSS